MSSVFRSPWEGLAFQEQALLTVGILTWQAEIGMSGSPPPPCEGNNDRKWRGGRGGSRAIPVRLSGPALVLFSAVSCGHAEEC